MKKIIIVVSLILSLTACYKRMTVLEVAEVENGDYDVNYLKEDIFWGLKSSWFYKTHFRTSEGVDEFVKLMDKNNSQWIIEEE